ncbi:MAG TPA: alanyl-tRNA editing protein [Bryobacteraceae bacterium]|nr:alanyl-tRNA editing protein [Bryobacteraceae bacterium]
MTQRLYYDDCYLQEFRANVVETAEEGRRVYLDRTAFYPTSGGQPFDRGTLGGAAVREVVDEEGRIAHLLEAPLAAGEVAARIDWERRYDHMQQHTGQHLLSAVLIDLFKIPTLSFHMGAVTSTIDIETQALDTRKIERVEERCAEIVAEARHVTISYEESTADLGLRKESKRSGTLRIVSISELDKSACGGTHVKSTAEIGPVLIRKLEKIRGNVRIEFVCGLRAVRQARQDFRTLSEISRLVSVPLEETPALVAAQVEKAKTLEKTVQRLAAELAKREGSELFAAAAPDASGVRRVTQRGPIDDAMRARAQAFAAGSKAVFLAVCEDPPSILLAASADSGVHAGDRVKAAVTAAGGRGGGNQGLAQGSVPSAALEPLIHTLSE